MLVDVYFILSVYLFIYLIVPIIMFNYFLYAADSKSGKRGETWQQGDLHRKDPNRLTGNLIASDYLDRKETFHQFGEFKT